MFRVIYMGTPDFAVPALRTLIESCETEVIAVVTREDKPKGRSGELAMPPVKELALANGIPVLQPKTARLPEFIEQIKTYAPDLLITCAYGRILPEEILNIPKYGTINVHASLLPKYRGAAPLWHMVIDGEQTGGVTTMMTDIGMDTGDILEKDEIAIGEDMTMGELHDVLSELGAKTLMRTLDKLKKGTLVRTKQDDSLATMAPMVDRETGHIDWNRDARTIHNLVRGVNPFPGAYTENEKGEKIKIWRTSLNFDERFTIRSGETGDISVQERRIFVKTGAGTLEILEIQGEGGKRMQPRDYLNGHAPVKFH